MNTKYNHLFFDLDHTLWDFETNSRLTLLDLFEKHKLKAITQSDEETFYNTYVRINEQKWALYRQGEISKADLRLQRFRDTFKTFGFVDDDFCRLFEEEYIAACPHQVKLLPGTFELLEYLTATYKLHIITNGFSETQGIKMSKSGLEPFFENVYSSENIGVNKPDALIFKEALRSAGADREESLMIGDSLAADIIGARNFGMDQVYFNPARLPHNENPTFEISALLEMKEFL